MIYLTENAYIALQAGAVILACMGFVFLGIRWRQCFMIRKIRRKCCEAESELKALQKAMPPVLFIESLAAITDALLDKDSSSANQQLSKFADRLRKAMH